MSTVSKKATVQHTGGEIQRRMELLLRAVKHQTSPATSQTLRKHNCHLFSVLKEMWIEFNSETELKLALTSCSSVGRGITETVLQHLRDLISRKQASLKGTMNTQQIYKQLIHNLI